jgi:ABC-type tungstate transport system substrate-binding protein
MEKRIAQCWVRGLSLLAANKGELIELVQYTLKVELIELVQYTLKVELIELVQYTLKVELIELVSTVHSKS